MEWNGAQIGRDFWVIDRLSPALFFNTNYTNLTNAFARETNMDETGCANSY